MTIQATYVDDRVDLEDVAGDGVADVLFHLANVMRAKERDARERREYRLAYGFQNRLDAYGHAAAIASHLSDPFRARVYAAITSRLDAIDPAEAELLPGVYARRILRELLEELGFGLA